jgi:hypothetical protein
MSLTLTEASSRVAYCYYCKQCGFRERVRLTLLAADLPKQTRVGDLQSQLPCGQCGDVKKSVMTLWLSATTTDRDLSDRGFLDWGSDDEC